MPDADDNKRLIPSYCRQVGETLESDSELRQKIIYDQCINRDRYDMYGYAQYGRQGGDMAYKTWK